MEGLLKGTGTAAAAAATKAALGGINDATRAAMRDAWLRAILRTHNRKRGGKIVRRIKTATPTTDTRKAHRVVRMLISQCNFEGLTIAPPPARETSGRNEGAPTQARPPKEGQEMGKRFARFLLRARRLRRRSPTPPSAAAQPPLKQKPSLPPANQSDAAPIARDDEDRNGASDGLVREWERVRAAFARAGCPLGSIRLWQMRLYVDIEAANTKVEAQLAKVVSRRKRVQQRWDGTAWSAMGPPSHGHWIAHFVYTLYWEIVEDPRLTPIIERLDHTDTVAAAEVSAALLRRMHTRLGHIHAMVGAAAMAAIAAAAGALGAEIDINLTDLLTGLRALVDSASLQG